MVSKQKRTRTGCLCCRKRHKKCDEFKPSCKFCVSKGLNCEWPKHGSVFVNYNLTDQNSTIPIQNINQVQFQNQNYSIISSNQQNDLNKHYHHLIQKNINIQQQQFPYNHTQNSNLNSNSNQMEENHYIQPRDQILLPPTFIDVLKTSRTANLLTNNSTDQTLNPYQNTPKRLSVSSLLN